jgi:hypothetical protein
VAVVVPLPIYTRFYTAVLQSGMSARRILSRSTPWDSDPLNPASTPGGDAAPSDAPGSPPGDAGDPAEPGSGAPIESPDWWAAPDIEYRSADDTSVESPAPPVANAEDGAAEPVAEADAADAAAPDAEPLARDAATAAPA